MNTKEIYTRKFSPLADLRFGLHSNIPLCCIIRFLWRENVRKPDYYSAIEKAESQLGKVLGFHYVPCYFCLFFALIGWQKPNKLHECDEDNPKCVKERDIFEAGWWNS